MLHLEKKLFFIYNPHAGKENIKGKLYGIIQAMSDAGYAITIYPTRRPRTPSSRSGICRMITTWWSAVAATELSMRL